MGAVEMADVEAVRMMEEDCAFDAARSQSAHTKVPLKRFSHLKKRQRSLRRT